MLYDLTGISCSALVTALPSAQWNSGTGFDDYFDNDWWPFLATQDQPAGVSALNSVSCPSNADCFAVGIDSILASTNSGYAWSPQAIPASVSGLNSIACTSVSDCTAVGFSFFGSPAVIGTTDGGATWISEPVPSGVGSLTGVSCVSASICQAVSDFSGSSPSIIVTTDGGSVWTTETFPATVTDFTGISCADENVCSRLDCRLRNQCFHPRHNGRWHDVDTANCSLGCDQPQRHLVHD